MFDKIKEQNPAQYGTGHANGAKVNGLRTQDEAEKIVGLEDCELRLSNHITFRTAVVQNENQRLASQSDANLRD